MVPCSQFVLEDALGNQESEAMWLYTWMWITALKFAETNLAKFFQNHSKAMQNMMYI